MLQRAKVKKHSRLIWSDLADTFSSSDLCESLEKLEERYNVSNEEDFFKKLVNTSVSKLQPYHRWVRYREGYAGDLVKEILSRYPNVPGGVVLDPMCGSGSTSVAASELGLQSIGLDVNPFAILSTEVKSYALSAREIQTLHDIVKTWNKAPLSGCFKFNEHEEQISKYFYKSNLIELVRIKRHIHKISDKRIFSILNFCLLAILEDCSNRKRDGNGLATRPSTVSNVQKRFLDQLKLVLNDYEEHPHEKDHIARGIELDARKLSSKVMSGDQAGAIIFSPPYANSFDYFESYKLELVFGEYSLLTELGEYRERLVRNYRINKTAEKTTDIDLVDALCIEIERKIPEKERSTGKRDSRTRLVPGMLRSYFFDMRAIIENCYSILLNGGFMHIVVDQSAYVGIPIPTDTILAKIAEDSGFKVNEMIVCRGASTSGQQLKMNPRLKELLRETIIVLEKTI